MENPMMGSHWLRAKYVPAWPLGEDGRAVTGCEAHKALCRRAAAEGMVLLRNNGVLPLKKGQKIALFGSGQVAFEQGGSGAGIVFSAYNRNLYEGLSAKDLEIFQPLSDFFMDHYEKELQYVLEHYAFGRDKNNRGTAPMLGEFTAVEKFNLRGREAVIDDDLLKQAAAFTDTALICINRTCGEFYDRELEGNFTLKPEEKRMIDQVKANFQNIVVVLNIGAQIEAAWLLDEKISAVLYMGTPGMEGGNAAADILCGDVCPSGRLSDTIALSYDDYPTSKIFNESDYYANYEEDIFVGYRYFETIPGAKEKVAFPFGYGLSYTTFTHSVESAGEQDGKIVITAKVTNTGSVSGKQVLQLYCTAPQGKLGKAAMSLVAFGKTQLLAPGESEVLTLTVDPYLMSSYDDTGVWCKSAYILEGGEYALKLGTDVRSTEVVHTYKIDGDYRLVQQLSERCKCVALPRKLRADGTFEDLPMLGMPPVQQFPNPPAITAQSCEKVSFDAVADGKVTVDQFIARMTDQQLFELMGGTMNMGVSVTSGFGRIRELGIPGFMTSDSPAGIRVRPETGLTPTAFPTADTVANSWDEKLAAQIGTAIAREIKENNMYAWLGPSMNIHRDPLCGRNFEYYSEDPLVAGKMAATIVRGAQSQRISASPKHFAANNKEFIRKECDSRVTERALREIYLKAFEICVREGDPKTFMTSYNPINGIYASESADLQTWILREEWGFDGLIMTDWNGHGIHGRELKAGSDIKMPRGWPLSLQSYLGDGPRTGGIHIGHLQAAARRILKVFLWYDGIDIK